LQYFREALSLTSDPAEQRERWLSISEVYYQMGNYDEALKSLDNITPTITTSASLTNRMENQKAKIFARQNNFGKAQGIYSNSITSRRENKDIAPADDKSLQQTKEEIVDVLHGQQRYDDEINLRNQSITYNRASNNLSEVTRDKVAIGKTLVAKGDNAAALREMEDAARTADSVDNPKDQANAYLSLAELYEKNDRRNLALKTYRKYSDAVARLEKLNDHRMIERADLINRQKEIEELSKDVSLGKGEETLAQATVTRQRLVIYGLILLMMVVGITSYFIYRSAQASKRANQLLALKSLRSQMNPHFIFNALNSVNQFIAAQDERTANKFLSEFSQLMRLVLDYSQRDFISLESEMEILGLYLKLEHYRFRDKFSYEIFIAPDLQTGNIAVPPMLIQPYIENAVWHGLRYKEEKGTLLLSFRQEAEMLVVEIRDDGIGRTQSAALKTENQKKHNSTGIRNIEERLAILNKVYKTRYRVTVDDGHPGTCVRIYLPMNHPLPLPL
jgi:tetratricopeptide (TPR) repeat protein